MPLLTTTVGSGIQRAGAYWAFGSNWSMATAVKVSALPTGSDKYCLWFRGDTAKVNPYIAIYWSSSGIYIEIFDGVTTTTTSTFAQQTRYANTWYYISITYTSFNTEISLVFNGAQTFPRTVNMGAIAFVQTTEYAGTDAGSALGGIALEYFRTWNAVASVGVSASFIGPAAAQERGSTTAVNTANNYADTPLTTGADLADISGNGRDWSAIGSLSTETYGPLDLVGGLFTSDFNTVPNFSEWTYVPNSAGVGAVGCGGSFAFGCNGSGQIWRNFAGQYNEGSARWITWLDVDAVPAGEFQLFTAQKFPAAGLNAFQLVLYAFGDGKLRLRMQTASSPVPVTIDFYTSPGAIANDGTPAAVQVVWSVDTTQWAQVYVNNVLTIDTGVQAVQFASVWTQVSFNAQPAIGINTVYDNIEVENQAVVEDWRVCTSNKVQNCHVIQAATARLTQLPVEIAYDYGILRPFISGGGSNWLTPPRVCSDDE